MGILQNRTLHASCRTMTKNSSAVGPPSAHDAGSVGLCTVPAEDLGPVARNKASFARPFPVEQMCRRSVSIQRPIRSHAAREVEAEILLKELAAAIIIAALAACQASAAEHHS